MTVFIVAFMFMMGSIVLALSYTIETLFAGRVIIGVGVAISAIVDVSYLSEISPPEWRGMIVSTNELFITIGLLLAFLIGYIVSPLPKGWRLMFGFPIILSASWIALMFGLPESPKWLLVNGRTEDALHVFRVINGGNEITANKEFASACATIEATHMMANRRTILDIFCRKWLLPLIVSVSLMLLQQFSGHAALLTYAPEIFSSVGLTTNASGMMTVVLGCIKVIFTLLSLCIVDITGRRTLLLVGVVGMTIGYTALSISLSASSSTSMTSAGNVTLALISLTSVVAFYALGFGPVTWLIVSEMFPDEIRGRALGIASGNNQSPCWSFLLLTSTLTTYTLLNVHSPYSAMNT